MLDTQINSSYIAEKTSRIRWFPEQYEEPDHFLTASWDLAKNQVSLWKLTQNEYENEFIPKRKAKLPLAGDLTAMEVISPHNVIVSSSNGFASILHVNRNKENDNLTEAHRFTNLHAFSTGEQAPCTGLAIYEDNIATIGEDGTLNILSMSVASVTKQMKEVDSCSMTCVSFINPKEILTGNRMGLIHVYDIRMEEAKACTATLLVSCEDDKKSNCVNCLTYHPTQKHIILGGSEEGSITVWDLRQPNFPASYISAHDHAITDIGFHKTQPTKLFTASAGGELWRWTQNDAQIVGVADMDMRSTEPGINPWLNGERAKNKINVTSLLNGVQKPINTFDAFNSKIICGSDNEAIYIIE